MSHGPDREGQIVEAILGLPHEQRDAYLQQACADDPQLRQLVEAMLQAHEQGAALLGRSPRPPAVVAPSFPSSEEPGAHIGRYKLLQQLGEGGYGVVYMAEQESPVKRKVALKIIKLGMDTRRVVARFEAERQALALMDHPNIARVLDAGATETGRPYFVMDLVRGVKITTYCDEQKLPIQQRLNLFLQVCQAVQHAHQKGIIHRDLKPSNILVIERDGLSTPKVIDFGIAKATGDLQLTDKTLFTAFEQFIGTPAYMSPEQARLGELDIDTRTDIYSLGVLLYELIAGQPPFDAGRLKHLAIDEVLKTIREEDPPRPSNRLTAMTEAQCTTVARCRQVDPPKLASGVRGDLDWIVMKCLEKDRTRRYGTANDLAADIKRHLNCEPILARPPSALYEFQKTVRRHKFGFGATAALIAVLAGGVLFSTREALRARRAEREQEHLRTLEEAAGQREITLRKGAEQQAKRADAAEADAQEKLRDSYLAQAQAGRWSQRAGRRFEGLDRLMRAAEIRPGPDLRNEAIACMALSDLHLVKEFSCPDEVAIDAAYERYAFLDSQGALHICRVDDSTQSRQVPWFEPIAPGEQTWLKFSPDGRFLLAAGGTNYDRVELMDLERNQVALRASGSRFRCADFSRDSRFMALSYEIKGTWPIRIFDLSRAAEVASFNHGSLPYYIRLNPRDPHLLLTSDRTSEVRLWDWTTGHMATFSHPAWVQGIGWHPNGKMFATASGDHLVRLWDMNTGEQCGMLAGHEWAAVQVAFSADGQFLATRGWEGIVRLWDPNTCRELVSMPVQGWINDRFSRSNCLLACGIGQAKQAFLEASRGIGYRVLHDPHLGDEGWGGCSFSPDGRWLVSTHSDGLHLWDLALEQQVGVIAQDLDESLASFGPNGTNLFFGSTDGIEEWLVSPGSSQAQTNLILGRRLDPGVPINGVLLSQDGQKLAALGSQTLYLYDLPTGQVLRRLELGYQIKYAALSSEAKLAATWARLSTNILVWNLEHSNLVQVLPAHHSLSAVFSPNGQWLAVGDEVEFRLWNLATWQSLYSMPRQAAGFWAFLAFSPDSRMLALAISRTAVRLVEPLTGRELGTFEAPDRADIRWLTFNHDSSQLAVAANLGLIQLWDLRAIRNQLALMKLNW